MNNLKLIACILFGLAACKNTEQATSASEKTAEVEKPAKKLKPIIVDRTYKPAAKPDFQVLEWTTMSDSLMVVVSYSGGCEEHGFNAYFSGGWLKSLPPQAMINLEHLNPNNDACRSLVKDTAYFDLTPVQFPGQNKVVVKWQSDSEKWAGYTY